jgi:large repetitive protein
MLLKERANGLLCGILVTLGLLFGLLGSVDAQTQVVNTATISVPSGVSNTNALCTTGTCTAADIDTITLSRPLVSKSFTPSTITAGGTSLLVINFTNTHLLTSATFTTAFTDSYPEGISNSSSPLATTTCASSGVTAAPAGSSLAVLGGTVIPPGASCSVSVVVTGILTGTNTIPAGSLTTSVGSNSATATAILNVTPTADLSIAKAVVGGNTNTVAGNAITFTLVISNAGPSTANNATFQDALPTGLLPGTVTSVNPAASATALFTGSTLNGTATSLPSDGVITVTFLAQITSSYSGLLTNTATVTPPAGVIDPNSANNTTRTVVNVSPLLADVSTTVSLPDSGTPGSNVTATVVYQNAGTATGTITFTPVIGGVAQTPVSLAPGASTTLLVVTPVTAAGATVTATFTGNNIPDTNPNNNLATDTLSPIGTQVVDISTTIAPASAVLLVGSTFSATVTFINLGSATLTFTPTFTVNGVTVFATQSITLTPGATTTTKAPVTPVTVSGAVVTAGVGATNLPETRLSNNTAIAIVSTQQPQPQITDISTTIALPTTGVVGSVVNATVTFVNLGPTATNFTATIIINGVAQAYSSTIPPGGEISVPVSVTVTMTGATVIAGVGITSVAETNTSNNTTSRSLQPLMADVSTTIALPSTALVGTTISGTVTFTNLGSATTSFTSTIVINGVTQTFAGAVPPGATLTVPITVPVTTTGATVFAGVGVTSVPELVTANNTTSVSLQPLIPDLSVTLVVPASATPAQSITATIVITNNGDGLAKSVTAILTLPDGRTVSVVLGTMTLVPGASITAIVGYSVPPAQDTTMSWLVNVSTPTPEVTLTNNFAAGTTTIIKVFNASVSGRVWLDSNSNRIYNPGVDSDLSGWRVELLQGNVVVGSATTGVNGTYTIPGQTPGGGYSIRFRNPAGQVIVATPFNQTPTTANGNASTGTTTSVVTGSFIVGGQIENVTLYAGDNVAEQNLPVDPSGVVYDAVTRQPVAGAQVTLIGPNGLVVPSSDLLGGNGSMTTDATGIYQFWLLPTAPAGNYRLEITPPAGYTATPAQLGGVAQPGNAPGTLPSQGAINGSGVFTPANNIAFVNVQPNSGAPAVGVNGAGAVGGPGTQYFFQFNLTPGGANPSAGVLHNHIPLDPLSSGALLISKTGDKSVAELGDSVRYTIRVRNTSNAPIAGVQVEDLLPAGFRYILGTARLNNNVLANPAGGVGRALTFNLGSAGVITGSTTWELSYYVRLGVGSQQGDGINRATAVFNGVNGPVRSNTAQYRVRVQGGVFSNEGCIAGKVYTDCDGNSVQNNESGSRELGIPGVRLVMLDGTQITTDSEGKYSICGVKPQTHVIKVDRTTLPKGSRLLPSSNRNAGVGDSIFVDLKGGELARADFIEGSCSPEVLDQIKARRALGGVLAPEKEIVPDLKIDNRLPQAGQQILPSLRPESPASANPGGKTP